MTSAPVDYRRPAEPGEFVMQVTGYGDPPGWWITAG